MGYVPHLMRGARRDALLLARRAYELAKQIYEQAGLEERHAWNSGEFRG